MPPVNIPPVVLSMGNIHIKFTDGWYSAPVEMGTINGVIFANQNPGNLLAREGETNSFLTGFVCGGIMVSSAPTEANPETIMTGMAENLPNYGDEDFSATVWSVGTTANPNMTSAIGRRMAR
jgi:hypothetical protein